jgi:hypothetical protein
MASSVRSLGRFEIPVSHDEMVVFEEVEGHGEAGSPGSGGASP